MSTASDQLRKFIGEETCLIVEPSQAFASSLQGCLKDLGVPLQQMVVTRKFEEAKRLIAERKPKILITEYEIESYLGLALIELQEQHHGEMSRLAAIVTRNNSDSAVAEAAEEQVDIFILKPFSVDAFTQKLTAAIQRKMSPSPYIQKINEGKRSLEVKKYSIALEAFTQAKPIEQKPTLAHFYTGQTYQMQGDKELALAEFQAGRKYHPLHYKCLIGEFETLVEDKRYKEAYELVPLIRENYPITARRLAQILSAAVFTYSFEDLPLYYELFLRLEQRPPQLTKMLSMAFLAAGRFLIKEDNLRKAAEFFDLGVTVTGRSLAYIELIVSELLKIRAATEAQAFLGKALQSDVGTARFNQLSYLVDELTLPKDELVEKGRKLVMAGEGSPDVYTSVVRIMAEQGKTTLAETVISRATSSFPELREPLYKILEAGQPKTGEESPQ